MKFCTYIHITPDGKPFYIGKSNGSKRPYYLKRNIYHARIVKKYGADKIIVRLLKSGLTEEEAFAHEKEAIECLRDFGYMLSNMTDGGEGTSGFKQSNETKIKISIANSGRSRPDMIGNKLALKQHSEETKNKMSESHRGMTRSKEAREKISKAHKGNAYALGCKRSQEFKDSRKGNKHALGFKHSIETRQKVSNALKGRKFSLEHRLRLSESIKNAMRRKQKEKH